MPEERPTADEWEVTFTVSLNIYATNEEDALEEVRIAQEWIEGRTKYRPDGEFMVEKTSPIDRAKRCLHCFQPVNRHEPNCVALRKIVDLGDE